MTHLEMLATLASAGFTKNDIAALARASQPAQKDQGPQFPVQPAPVPAPTQPTPAPAPAQPDFNKLLEELTGIKAALQGNNLANAQMPGGQPETTDDILAAIINPPSMKGV